MLELEACPFVASLPFSPLLLMTELPVAGKRPGPWLQANCLSIPMADVRPAPLAARQWLCRRPCQTSGRQSPRSRCGAEMRTAGSIVVPSPSPRAPMAYVLMAGTDQVFWT